MTTLPEKLPISMLNQYAYCPRRFWLMYVQSEMLVNAAVFEGTLQHERVHTAGRATEGGEVRYRRLRLWSDEWGLTGFADLVEEQDGLLIPVEYKRGKMGKWLNDHLQLCAQALCIEERTGQQIPYGYIFYWRSRRRVRVELDAALRAKTTAALVAIRELLAQARMPLPDQPYAKCRDCSLEPICLPREISQLVK
ncbi:MAG: CRISPR-associated protein Cas4 [Chloroflexota bacterium]|nr:CRISPR-associated protein Cas4 [Chloroflexota bacterium]